MTYSGQRALPDSGWWSFFYVRRSPWACSPSLTLSHHSYCPSVLFTTPIYINGKFRMENSTQSAIYIFFFSLGNVFALCFSPATEFFPRAMFFLHTWESLFHLVLTTVMSTYFWDSLERPSDYHIKPMRQAYLLLIKLAWWFPSSFSKTWWGRKVLHCRRLSRYANNWKCPLIKAP